MALGDIGFIPRSDEPKPKKPTNADYIRSMTDEELGAFIAMYSNYSFDVLIKWLSEERSTDN